MKINLTLFIGILTIAKLFAQDFPLETVIQKGHSKYVTCSDFSPDNKYIVTGSYDHTIKLWDIKSGKQIREFHKHTNYIRSLVFSPDGKQILSTGADNRMVIFEVITGKVLFTYELEKNLLLKAFYSSDGNYIVAINNTNEAFLWDAKELVALDKVKKAYGYSMNSTYINAERNEILVYNNYKSAFVVDLKSRKNRLELEFDKPHSMSFSSDGKYIAIGSTRLFSTLFDAETGKELFVLRDNEEEK